MHAGEESTSLNQLEALRARACVRRLLGGGGGLRSINRVNQRRLERTKFLKLFIQPYTIPKFSTRIGLGSAKAFHKGSADRRDRPVERQAIEGSAKDRPDPSSKDRADRRDRVVA